MTHDGPVPIDAPPSTNGRTTWAEIYETLRAAPGQWFAVKTYKNHQSARTAGYARNAPGYQFTARDDVLYGRYQPQEQ